jgi:uncharacterized membrane protein YphA (DoxX/SURF4 family)
MPTAKKIQIISLLVLLTCFIQFYLSKELWLPDKRVFPVIPFFEFLPFQLNRMAEILLLFLMSLSFILILIFPTKKKYLLLFSIPALLFVLEDAMRLQPWFYLHFIMITLIAFEKRITHQNLIRFLQLIVAAIYFWSGFNKLNIAFAWEIFPWLMEPFSIGQNYFLGFDNLNSFPLPVLNYVAYVIPIFEITLAIFLLIPKLRFVGVLMCVLTHLFSIYAIGPFGQNWNFVVWPWNIEMPILCWLLFYKMKDQNSFQNYWFAIKSTVGVLIVFLFLLAPALSFLGKWDKGLALHLYSGQTTQMEFYFQGFQKKLINSSIAEYLSLDTNSMQSIMHTRNWANEQLGVPMYSEPRYLKKVGLYLCNCLENKEDAGITIYERNGFYSQQDTLKISCFDLE